MRFSLIIIFLFISQLLFSQDNLQTDVILKNSGDTIYCKIGFVNNVNVFYQPKKKRGFGDSEYISLTDVKYYIKEGVKTNATDYQNELENTRTYLLFKDADNRIKNNELTFYGVDFTYLKLIRSDFDYGYLTEIINHDFAEINRKIQVENDKYDIKNWFNKVNVKYEFSYLDEKNKTKKVDELMFDEPSNVKLTDMKESISKYTINESNGLGLTLFYETWYKNEDYASYGEVIFVFFDIETREIIAAERYKSDPNGFGTVNFWLTPILEGGRTASKDYKKVYNDIK